MDKHKQQFLATSLLVGMEDGWEMLAQWVASYFSTGNADSAEVFEEMSGFYGRVNELIANPLSIWRELVPGGTGPDGPPLLEALEAIAKGYSTVVRTYRGDTRVDVIENPQPRNIVLAFPLAIYQNDDQVWFSDGAEFFKTEDGEPYVKFVPVNGLDKGKEHIVHMNMINHFVRRD